MRGSRAGSIFGASMRSNEMGAWNAWNDNSSPMHGASAREVDGEASTPPIHVLIISYHFPPLNVIASFRAQAFAKYLPGNGIATTVLTLQWEAISQGSDGRTHFAWQKQGTPCLEERSGSTRMIRLPRVRTLFQRFIDTLLGIPVISWLTALLGLALGRPNLHTLYAHIAFKRFLKVHLKSTHYDAVIAMMSPDEHVALGAWVKKRFGTPLIADYRDAYDNQVLAHRPSESLGSRVKILLKRWHHHRWNRTSDMLVSVSRPLLSLLQQHTGVQRVLEVRNGFDPMLVDADDALIDREFFHITYAGMLYPNQDIDPFIRAVNSFLDELSEEDAKCVRVRFFAPRNKVAEQKLTNGIRSTVLEIRPRVSRQEIGHHMGASSIFLMMDYGMVGMYTGKFMEYIGYRRNILMVPSDHDVVSTMIQEAKLGLQTDDWKVASEFLLARFQEWRTLGRPSFKGDPEKIEEASRPAQVRILANGIRSLLADEEFIARSGGAPRNLSS
jgi:glycosyltransferase involved in cell wall biosynthesis